MTCTGLPSHISGSIRLVTTALAFTEPRFDQTSHPMAGFDAFLFRQLLGNFDEEFRLHHGVEADVFGPEMEMLGQPVGGCRVGELLGVAELLPVVLEHARHRIAANFRRDEIGDRRFERLVVGGERSVAHHVAARTGARCPRRS